MAVSSSHKFTSDFWSYLQANPQAQIAAIVRCERLSPDYVQAVEEAGLRVSRQLRLIKGLAVEGKADALIALASKPWVLHIEPDQPVHTMR